MADESKTVTSTPVVRPINARMNNPAGSLVLNWAYQGTDTQGRDVWIAKVKLPIVDDEWTLSLDNHADVGKKMILYIDWDMSSMRDSNLLKQMEKEGKWIPTRNSAPTVKN